MSDTPEADADYQIRMAEAHAKWTAESKRERYPASAERIEPGMEQAARGTDSIPAVPAPAAFICYRPNCKLAAVALASAYATIRELAGELVQAALYVEIGMEEAQELFAASLAYNVDTDYIPEHLPTLRAAFGIIPNK